MIDPAPHGNQLLDARLEAHLDANATTQSLIQRVHDGDLSAFEALYRQTRDDVARAMVHLVERPAVAGAVGELYTHLLDALRDFPVDRPLLPLLHRLCAQAALRRARWRTTETAGLFAVLARLPAKLRIVFVFHEVLGLSAQEIGAAADISQSTVHSRLRRARLQLLEAVREPESNQEAAP